MRPNRSIATPVRASDRPYHVLLALRKLPAVGLFLLFTAPVVPCRVPRLR